MKASLFLLACIVVLYVAAFSEARVNRRARHLSPDATPATATAAAPPSAPPTKCTITSDKGYSVDVSGALSPDKTKIIITSTSADIMKAMPKAAFSCGTICSSGGKQIAVAAGPTANSIQVAKADCPNSAVAF